MVLNMKYQFFCPLERKFPRAFRIEMVLISLMLLFDAHVDGQFFKLETVKEIKHVSGLEVKSNAKNGFKTDASKDICKEAAEKTGLSFDTRGDAGACCGYHVTLLPNSSQRKKGTDQYVEYNLVQCPGGDFYFYLRKIREIEEKKNNSGDVYDVHVEDSFYRTNVGVLKADEGDRPRFASSSSYS